MRTLSWLTIPLACRFRWVGKRTGWFTVPVTRLLWGLVGLAAVLVGCGEDTGPQHNSAAEASSIEGALRQWSHDFNEGDLDAVCGLFADGAVLETVTEDGVDVFTRQPDGRWQIHISHAFPVEPA